MPPNHVDGAPWGLPHGYLVAQAPSATTVGHWWAMVTQAKVCPLLRWHGHPKAVRQDRQQDETDIEGWSAVLGSCGGQPSTGLGERRGNQAPDKAGRQLAPKKTATVPTGYIPKRAPSCQTKLLFLFFLQHA